MLSEKMHKALEYVRDAKGVRTQKEFALAVGMSADRLRNVVNDKIKKLQPDEAVAIERAFGIRSAWWFTEVAPMLLTDQELNALGQLNEVRNASAEVLALGLNGWQANFVQELLFNVRTKNGGALRDQLSSALTVSSSAAQVMQAKPEIAELLEQCGQSDRNALEVLIRSLARQGGESPLGPDGRYPKREEVHPMTLHDKPRKKGA